MTNPHTPSPRTAPIVRPTTPSPDDLTALAEDIVRFAPSLTHLLLAMAPQGTRNPLEGLN